MPVPDTLNARIAMAEGWTWHEKGEPVTYQVGIMWADDVVHWQNPVGEWAIGVPDYVGTLTGVAGLLRELNEWAKRRWVSWTWNPTTKFYHAQTAGDDFISEPDRPGDCVGEAWLAVFEEKSDA